MLSVEKRGALTFSESLTSRQIKAGYHQHTSFYHGALRLIDCRLRQFCKMNAFPRYLFPKLNFPKNEFALRTNPFMRITDQRSTTVSQWVTLEGILAIKFILILDPYGACLNAHCSIFQNQGTSLWDDSTKLQGRGPTNNLFLKLFLLLLLLKLLFIDY